MRAPSGPHSWHRPKRKQFASAPPSGFAKIVDPLRVAFPDVPVCVPVHLAGPGGLFVDKVLRFVVRLARVPGRVASDAGPGRQTCRAGAAIHTVLSGLITVRTSGTNVPR